MASAYAVMAIVLSLCLGLVLPILAVDYNVGDSSGWGQGMDYTQWATGKNFVVGDNLVFSYASPPHSLMEVSQADYDRCSAANTLNADTNSGTTTIPLKTPGIHYFICGVPSHCTAGMKVAVTVSAATATPTPSISGPTNPTITPYLTPPPAVVPPVTTTTTTTGGYSTYRPDDSSSPLRSNGKTPLVIAGAAGVAIAALLS